MKVNRAVAAFLLTAFLGSTSAWADVDPLAQQGKVIDDLKKELSEMKQTIASQNEKIHQLEIKGPQASGSNESAPPTPTPAMSDKEFSDRLGTALGGADKWLKDLKFSGDLRLRYDGQGFHSGNPRADQPRNRFRFRVRYGFEKTFSDEMKIGFAMATSDGQVGGTSTNPTSENQTMGNLFDYKNIWFDKAYATYTPNWAKIGPVQKLEITAGKFNNPFEIGSSEMIWDRDIRPEGVYEKINFNVIDSDNLNLNGYLLGGQYVINESAMLAAKNPFNTAVTGDTELWAVQGGLNPVFYVPFMEKPVDFLTAFSYYNYMNYGQDNNFTIAGTSLARGNPNVSGPFSQLDAREFQVVETYNEIAVYPFGFPTRFFFDGADNVGASTIGNQGGTILHNNLAWALGTRLGSVSKKGDWEARYEYRYIGANAVVGAFADDDFGNGGAGKQGSMLKLSYCLTDNLILSCTGWLVSNLNSGTAGVIDEQQRRIFVDLLWKF